MRVYQSAFFAVVVCLAALPARAQDAAQIEITPYLAIGSAGASPVGTAITVPITSTLALETDVAYRRGEGNIHALSTSASLLWFLPRVGRATPYAAAGIGLSQFGAPVSFAPGGQPVGTQKSLTATVNAGGGIKMAVSEKVDMRTDARWFKSFGRYGSEQFRVAQGLSFDVGRR